MSKKQTTPLVLHPPQISSLPPSTFPPHIPGGHLSWHTLFSSPSTPTRNLTAGIATCPAGTSTSCAGHLNLHRHAQPELYYVVTGTGIVVVEGKEYEVGEGSVVYIPGNAEHGVRNEGEGELRWLYVFGVDGFEEVVYRFSEGGGLGKGKGVVRAKL